jgi:hypothetical protein
LLSFVESAPRAYRLKVGNADLFRNSTEPGTSPPPPAVTPLPTFDPGPNYFLSSPRAFDRCIRVVNELASHLDIKSGDFFADQGEADCKRRRRY